jgi:hypothetical protein
MARTPARLASAATVSQASSLRLTIATSAPASANPIAIARPRPREPPVINADLPFRLKRSVIAIASSNDDPALTARCPRPTRTPPPAGQSNPLTIPSSECLRSPL